MVKLGVNIDHVATIRQARGECDPDPVLAADICQQAGADSIVAHLREDRRHIQEGDIILLKKTVTTRFNLEMSVDARIVKIALGLAPHQVTLVPERRRELTTEGGLDVVKYFKEIEGICEAFREKGIDVSLFIDPDKKQINAAFAVGASIIEIHTGSYAQAFARRLGLKELDQIKNMTAYAKKLGMVVNAGHGLNYDNTAAVARIKGIEELNIGHAIISRAVFVGLRQAVREMLAIIKRV